MSAEESAPPLPVQPEVFENVVRRMRVSCNGLGVLKSARERG